MLENARFTGLFRACELFNMQQVETELKSGIGISRKSLKEYSLNTLLS